MSKFFKALEQAERDRAAQKAAGARDAGSRPASSEPPAPAAPGNGTLTERSGPALVPVGPRPAPPVEPPPAPRAVDAPPPAAVRPVGSRGPAVGAPPTATLPASAPASRKRAGEGHVHPKPAPGVEPAPVSSEIDPHLVSLVEPTAFAAEQYRTLRDLIEHLHRTSELGMVAVSSPGVGDGKTTTALNLAGALAQDAGNRVLLIEVDLRRPTVAQQLGRGIYQDPGLTEALLRPGVALDDVTIALPDLSFSIIPAGGTPEAAYEVLTSDRFRELLAEARRRYDYVILDTPPLIPLPDCRVIERLVDGVVVVVAAHRTPRKLVEEALHAIDRAKVVGLVFNGDDRPVKGYYGRYHLDRPAGTNGHGPNGAGPGWRRKLGRWR